jgi:hypothetical protein
VENKKIVNKVKFFLRLLESRKPLIKIKKRSEYSKRVNFVILLLDSLKFLHKFGQIFWF